MENNAKEKFRAEIYLLIFEKLRVIGNLNLNYVEFESGNKYHTAYGLISDPSDPIYIIVAIPNHSNDVYIMMSDGDPIKLARELAGIQQYNEEKAHICIDHTVPTENEYLVTNGWSSYLTLVPKIAHESLPYAKEVRGKNLLFKLVVPITEKERQFKIEHGIDLLLDSFDKIKRDIVSFAQNQA